MDPKRIVTLDEYLSTFRSTIGALMSDNVVIGGIHALKMHGLKMSRETNDLDIIIYSPTVDQMKVLELLRPYQVEKKYKIPYDDFQRSYKFQRHDIYVDFLLEKDKATPRDLLLYKSSVDGQYYQIQSIENVIEAKKTYRRSDEDLRGLNYVREKDVKDFQDLKNSNFNF